MREKIRALRLESGLTQKELATKLNSTDKSIWNYENGIATPPYEVLIAYAKFFEVSADYLLGLEDDFGTRTATTAALMLDTNTDEERELIGNYRLLNQSGKRLVNETIKTLLTTAGGSDQKKKFN